jgi:hypothetical protein
MVLIEMMNTMRNMLNYHLSLEGEKCHQLRSFGNQLNLKNLDFPVKIKETIESSEYGSGKLLLIHLTSHLVMMMNAHKDLEVN